MEFPSKVIEDGVNELSKLPGIGKKTALRLALFILKGSEGDAEGLGNAIIALRKGVKYCKQCGNLTDEEICRICSSHRRNQAMICVVEDCKDVIAIENTGQYTGTYHVLNGIIHPMQGLGPSDLNIESLLNRLRTGACEEVIFALPSSMEGDMTSFYIARKLEEFGVRTSSIARGIPVGSDLEFTDEITLARSLINRTSLTQSTGNGI
ncbi:MAG: recombination protein RecR [Bacteroidetes bacterium]|nr:recombination protein RecR [Bacteroidota bacterium]MBL0020411.1 recombination protein RecR [Bacteroidota bacterium]